MTAVKIETKFISPAEAERILSTNNINRPVLFASVLTLANIMNLGKWQLNGETIIIAQNGKLLDGQHRLFAIIEHGKPVEMAIATGAPNDAFETIDSGRSRSGADVAYLKGVANPTTAVAAAVLIWRMWHKVDYVERCPAALSMRVIDRYPAIRKWSGHISTAKSSLLPKSAFLASLVYFEDIAQRSGQAERFFEGMTRGVELAEGAPVLALRNRMITYRNEGRRLEGTAIWGATVRVINALEAGEVLHKVAISASRGGITARPAMWEKHLADLPKGRDLNDLRTTPKHGPGFKRQFAEAVEEIRSRAAG